VVEEDPEFTEGNGALALVLNTEVGSLSSVPVEAPIKLGDLLGGRISDDVEAEGVLLVEVGEVTFGGV
jgi:hypothetical protein